MSENLDKDWTQESWTAQVEEYAKLEIGENTFEVTGEPTVKSGKFGPRLSVPTSIGEWRISLNSPVARELKDTSKKLNGHIEHVVLTVVKTGDGKDTRYTIKKVLLPGQKQEKQAALNLDNLTPEQKQQLEQILKQKEQQ